MLIALTHRNSFKLFKAGKKTLVMEWCVTKIFEAGRIEVYWDIFPVIPASEGEWRLSW
jgi:hypothetical protein